MKLRFYSVALMMGVLAGVAVGEDGKAVDETAALAAMRFPPKGKPLAQLPEGIPSAEGKVTLFADYARAKPGEPIDVYLINRSARDLMLSAQDGDVYLKLEKQNADGSWTRVQPHVFSWCGNSYDVTPVVQKGSFFQIKGHQPKTGAAAKIRFHLYMQHGLDLATEAGDGMVSAEEAQKAACDALAVGTGSFEMVRDFALGAKAAVGDESDKKNIHQLAIRNLRRFAPEQVLPLLDEIEKKFPEFKSDVEDVRYEFKQKKGR